MEICDGELISVRILDPSGIFVFASTNKQNACSHFVPHIEFFKKL